MDETAKEVNVALAVVLSALWCGVGQLYNGELGKGIGLIVAYFISCTLIIAGIGLITTPCLWVYGMVDAYRGALRKASQ